MQKTLITLAAVAAAGLAATPLFAQSESGRRFTVTLEGEQEVGRDSRTNAVLVKINPQFYRPAEVDLLIGDSSHARAKLGWQAETTLEELCHSMVKADLRRVQDGKSF